MSVQLDATVRPHVLVTGPRADDVLHLLGNRADIAVVDGRRGGAARRADAVIHAVEPETALHDDLLALRSFTTAPVIVAVAGAVNGLLDEALREGVHDVLMLPQAPETFMFSVRKAVSVAAESQGRGRIVAITSQKGGSGKTALATNLAAALARSGRRTLLVDLDLQFGDAAVMLGVPHDRSVVDLASGDAQLDSDKLLAFAVADERSGAAVVPAPHRPEEAEAVRDSELVRLLAVAKQAYDAVVVDTAPLFDRAMMLAVDAADEVLVVCTPDIPSLKNAKIGLETLKRLGVDADRVSLVLNRVGGPAAFGKDDVEHTLDQPVRFLLPEDPAVPEAINRSSSAVSANPAAPFARAAARVAAELVGDEAPAAAPTRRRLRIGGA
ncbi:MAG TPA: AAA family ATPase [Gaiellaceae bacterium]|nr:AAA family ATPase [Gaiellaceae bacterium]